MADLFGLLQDLGEKIASKGGSDSSSGSTQPQPQDEEDPVETRFRCLLPNLLKSYFVPSKVKEREFVAILKLLCHTAKNYPGVFYHGKAFAVLPILAQVFPFFVEAAIRGRLGVLFETVWSLLLLLKHGDRDVYRQFFIGATHLVEDLVSVALLFTVQETFTQTSTVSIKCFEGAYSIVDLGSCSDQPSFCELPAFWKPVDGPGIILDISGKDRWQPLAEWTIKLLGRFLAESILLVEGLITAPFLSALGNILCYGDSSLQKICFELFHAVVPVVDIDAIPGEKLVLSIIVLLSTANEQSFTSRDNAYDSALGLCLSSLLTSVHKEVIESTAQDLLEILLQTIHRTKSQELKAAMCVAFEQILKHCPPFSWKLDSFLPLLFVSDINSHVCKCIQCIIDALDFKRFVKETVNSGGEDMVKSESEIKKQEDNSQQAPNDIKMVKKRKIDADKEETNPKRQKLEISRDAEQVLDASTKVTSQEPHVMVPQQRTYFVTLNSTLGEQKQLFSMLWHKKMLDIINKLQPTLPEAGDLELDGILSAFYVLANAFTGDFAVYNEQLLRQVEIWISWITDKAQDGSFLAGQLSTFMGGLEKLLDAEGVETMFQGSRISNDFVDFLRLPWTVSFDSERETVQKIKCMAVTIMSKLGARLLEKPDLLPIYTLALKDDNAFVRQKTVLSLPDGAAISLPEKRSEFWELLGAMCIDQFPEVRGAVAQTVGCMACVCCTRDGVQTVDHVSYMHASKEPKYSIIMQSTSICCPICGTEEPDQAKLSSGNTHNCHSFINVWRPFFSRLLFEEETQQVQVAFIMSMSSLLLHSSHSDVLEMKDGWLKCIDVLTLHPQKVVRKAFCSQIRFFFQVHVLQGLFGDDPDSDYASRELLMLGRLKHALNVTEDPDILEDLLEMVAEIVHAACNRQQLFFFALVLLLEQLDSKHAAVQVNSVRLLQKCAAVKGRGKKSKSLQLMVHRVQNELFEYLSGRLVSRPLIVRSFADAVLGLETSDLIRQMIPVVLPKLVIQQQCNCDALNILYELARQQETELPLLLLEWCHKVLSILLLKADGKELMDALQFYEAQTGSDTREIFSAVLPALLDELVWFLGDTASEDSIKRSARVAPMIQEVACIVSGSEDLPAFLKTHFVGLLNSIDRKMLKGADNATQKQGLRCIDRLMEMIGSHLSAFVPKIMVLLTRALQEPALQYECLQVWLSFVKRLAHVSPSNLKSVASQIVVAVMPCLEGQQEGILASVVEVLEELLIINKSILEDQASELPLLPSLPELVRVNTVLQQARGVTRLFDQLQKAAEGLRHENISVRLMASNELKMLLKSRKKDIIDMVLAELSSDTAILSQLVMSLMQGCAEESRTSISERLKLSCAECLGELGAMDPVKLHLDLRARSKIKRSDDDLVYELIDKHLVRVLRAASETDVQDAAALAIQELLKISGCQEACLGISCSSTTNASSTARKGVKLDVGNSSREMVERGEKLWSRFSDDIKDIITPCLTSKYLLKHSNTSTPSGSIFRPGMSFRRWMYLWVRRLVTLSSGPRSLIFNACKGLLRHDMATVLYLLPYLVLNVVCDGTADARACVTDEILSVLAEAGTSDSEPMGLANGGELSSGACCRSWSGPNEVSIQAVFTLLDNLAQWMDENKQVNDQQQPASEVVGSRKGQRTTDAIKSQLSSQLQASQYNHVAQLLETIPKTALAGASFRCQAYARALLYFESHIRVKSGALNPAAEKSGIFDDDDISFLLGVYSGLDEPDGLSGLSRLHKTLGLQDKVLINEKAGNWAEALTCCEQALQMNPKSVSRHFGVLNCLLNMGHLQAMAIHVDGLLLRLPEYKKEWSTWGVQAAWRLGQWSLLEEYLHVATGGEFGSVDSSDAFDINLAKVLQALQNKDCYGFSKCMIQARHALLAPLAAASMESYSRAYPLIVKLQMLHELETFHEVYLGNGNEIGSSLLALDDRLQEMVVSWRSRIRITQPSLWTREPILALRRLILSISNMQLESGDCWLEYAKLCRAAGHHETASRAILEAQSAGAPNAHIELAKLLWDTKKSHRAIAELQQALAKVPIQVLGIAREAALGGLLHIPSGWAPADREQTVLTQSRRDENMDAAKALLLLARWVHTTGQKQKEEVLSMYIRVKELQPTWEKGYFFLAKYVDDLLVDARKRQEEAQEQSTSGKKRPVMPAKTSAADEKPWWAYLPDVILYYAKGLHKGHRRLFQALPRLLTLWFEFGSSFHGEVLSANTALKSTHARVMSIMRGCLKDLPSYQWLTALSQLVSRICHQNEEVLRLVKHIIITVLQAYPHQALWTMAAVSKSTVPARRQAAAEIIQNARNGLRQDFEKLLFSQFTALIEQLIRLCFHGGGSSKARTLTVPGELKRMMPVGVIMPIQRALTVALPADGLTNSNYNPFSAGDYSTISGIADEVEILASLQKPKKVILHGSDGTVHPFLCKPKDDLRKDARMMEFTTTINRLLSKDPKSRRRKLYIRTFAVIPLTEDCGMVEWVLHTRGLRHILQDLYVSCGKFDRQKTNPTIKLIYDENKDKVSEMEIFQTKILPMFPPVFHKWFLNTFSEPANWFQSRIAYAHTTAVWSMVGHIVGLGDRHGENILFDSTTGDCVHVDFSCLFDKGLQLEKPELVPFRLTQNMVDGFGITGYEGVFSRVCEITLSVLRANRETLMSVLETFIHDPLVEWTKSHKSSGVEVKNPHAQRAMSNIEARLQGVIVGVGAAPSLPLSVEGQAHRLIAEAVSHENLGRMYIWWMPWF